MKKKVGVIRCHVEGLLEQGGIKLSAVASDPSVRAVNVLKLLAPEIIGETPPGGHWTPPNALLQKITINTLATARNCGPQTRSEIIAWAASP